MKKLLLSLLAISVTFVIFAQSPQKMNYQCVVRSESGILVTNQSVGIRISILQGTPSGTLVYQETYNPNPQTNANGLVIIEIGSGLVMSGTFSAINWAAGPYFLKTETDPTGATDYSIIGVSEMISVPFALSVKHAERISGDIAENDPKWATDSANHYTKTNMQFNGSAQLHFDNLTNKPATIAGYGITDAVATSGNQTINGNKTFTGTITGTLNANNRVISNVASPIAGKDIATKAYVDTLISKINDLNEMQYGRISRKTLEQYLLRSIKVLGLNNSSQLVEDLRMLKNIDAKFISRAAFLWGDPQMDDTLYFSQCEETAELVHQVDPDIILEACIFEAIYPGVNNLPIPVWVFNEFGLEPEQRNFNFMAMLYDTIMYPYYFNCWDIRNPVHGSVPDMSKIETRMWFFYRARCYIDAGYEALHLGQVEIMDDNDPGHIYWIDLLSRVRTYAIQHGRRHFVLCNAGTSGVVENGKLLFDFHRCPLRIQEVVNSPYEGILVLGVPGSIYGKSMGGESPSGWECEHLPYLVEFDNVDSTGKGGQRIGFPYVWGWDEICWFARQPYEYRNEWLRYAWKWVHENDTNGWLEMPGRCYLADSIDGISTYYANTKSEASPYGFGQEETIKDIWAK